MCFVPFYHKRYKDPGREKKSWWANDGRTAHYFFFKDNGRKNEKKNNGRTIGAPPKFCFLPQFLFSKKSGGCKKLWTSRKTKEIDGKVAHDSFFSNGRKLKKKTDGRTMGAAPIK